MAPGHGTRQAGARVGATTACLRALGVGCDQAEVAALSGHAFALTVHRELCPSGPTVLDWRALGQGMEYLGRAPEAYASGVCYGPGGSVEGRAACHAVYGLAAGEVAQGRPCVIWGAYVPEFAVAIGVQDGAFLVKSYREVTGEPQPPIPCEDLQAPGGPYYLGFPTTRPADRQAGDRYALRRAVEHLLGEGRSPAGDYAFGEAADALRGVAALFPFPQGGRIAEEGVRAQAITYLQAASAAETRALEALEEAAGTA